MRWFVLGFSPIFPLARTTSPRRLSSSGRKPSSLPDIPSLLAVSNCRSSCSQVLSASFFSSWDKTLSLTTSFGLAKCASGFSTLSFAFDVFAIGCLLAGDYHNYNALAGLRVPPELRPRPSSATGLQGLNILTPRPGNIYRDYSEASAG